MFLLASFLLDAAEALTDVALALAGVNLGAFLMGFLADLLAGLSPFFLFPEAEEDRPLLGVRPPAVDDPDPDDALDAVVDEAIPLFDLLALLGGGAGGGGVFDARSSTSPPDIRNAICCLSVIREKSMDPSSFRGRRSDEDGGRSRRPRSRGMVVVALVVVVVVVVSLLSFRPAMHPTRPPVFLCDSVGPYR